MSEDKEQDRGTSRETEVEWDIREAIDISNDGFYYKITVSSREECDFSSMWQVVQNEVFCSNNGRNISRRAGKVIYK